MIIVNDLVKKYKGQNKDEEIAALDELTMFLPDKGFIAIYGASGCGKSTLLNVLGGLDQADSGMMIVNGRDTTKFTKSDWDSYRNQQVGFIFQNYFLLPHLNVYDNIAITLQMSKQTEGMKEKIYDALKQVDMAKYAKRFPRQLSGGQQQRVAIARALISNPAIILADEPTGALDEKSSQIVMANLQEISKTHLVVMVTHNERMAKKYADRMIEISYGKIVSDEVIQEVDEIENKEPLLKVHLPLLTSLSWSVRNVIKKKGRSIPIAIASAIGLAAAGVVLSMTRGVNDFVDEAQKTAVRDYPVYVTCYPSKSSESNKEVLEEFPNIDEIIIEKSDYNAQEHYITMQDEFMDYMEKGLKAGDDYAHVYSNKSIKFNLFTELQEESYVKINTGTYTTCIAPSVDTYKFIKEQYEIIDGDLPKNANELSLVVDTFNRVDLYNLQQMGFDTTGDTIKFSDIRNKEFRIVGNNDFYTKSTRTVDVDGVPTTRDVFSSASTSRYQDLYLNKSFKTLKITGIIRPIRDTSNPIYSNILLFHPDLFNELYASNMASEIVKTQENNRDYDVFNGLNFQSTITSGYELTPQYLYENRMVEIGGKERITALYYYTDNTDQRIKIMNFADAYQISEDAGIIIRTRDYLEQVTSAFSSIVRTFSVILLAFALVSVFVSAILTAILTYISVVERKREIGLLRSLGARKRDISYMFITEAMIIGVVAGLLGIALCYIMAPIASNIVVKLIEMANTGLLTPKPSQFSKIQVWLIPLLIIGAVVVGVVSSLIPAIIAGKKKPADALKE